MLAVIISGLIHGGLHRADAVELFVGFFTVDPDFGNVVDFSELESFFLHADAEGFVFAFFPDFVDLCDDFLLRHFRFLPCFLGYIISHFAVFVKRLL